jgi:uncharacterized membrane protein YfcA
MAFGGTVPVTSPLVAGAAAGCGGAGASEHATYNAAITNAKKRHDIKIQMVAFPAVQESVLLLLAIAAGGVASISGFGIGSILTPALSLWFDAKLAVAAVSVPHVIGTAIRFWMLKGHVHARVMWSFGLASAAGGIAGALLSIVVQSGWLLGLLGVLLVVVGLSEWTGLSRRLAFTGATAWIAGAVSGLLGGLVGNQGGLRSAALLGFPLPRETFVATATSIALFVDAARMPVYFFTHGREMWTMRTEMAVMTAGVIAGTVFGGRVLRRIPEDQFRRVVAVLLAALGIALLVRSI